MRLQLLETTFWSAGGSRHRMADAAGVLQEQGERAVAGLLEQGLLAEAGCSAPRRPPRPRTCGCSRHSACSSAWTSARPASSGGARARPELAGATTPRPADVREGPGVVLARVRALMRELLRSAGFGRSDVIAIGIGVPGPVDFAIGQLVNPPLMPDWDSYSIRDDLREDYAAPVFVDNDVNLMALGELWRLQRALPNFLVIKVGTGIGCGIVCHGEVYRGANGSAGDVGHICVDPDGPALPLRQPRLRRDDGRRPGDRARGRPRRRRPAQSPLLAERLRAAGRARRRATSAQASRAGDAAANAIVQRAGSADRPDAGLGGQLLQPVARVHRRRRHAHRPAVPRRACARASTSARWRCRPAISRSSTRRSATRPA